MPGDRFLHEALEVHRSLLPHFWVEGAAGEWSCWRALWADIPQRDRPSTLIGTMKNCNSSCFLLVSGLLRIASCQPVTTARVGREVLFCSQAPQNFAALYDGVIRSRLSGLTMMNIHPGQVPLSHAILDSSMMLKNRRIH